MSDRLILSDESLYSGIEFRHAPVKPGVTALSIMETVRSGIPSNKSKYDRNERVDELYRTWSQSWAKTSESRYEKVVLLFYELYRPRITAIAKKYKALSPIFDEDDLQQTGLLGVFQALVKYDHAEHIDMKFSTYLEWSIRNVFQRTIGCTDKFVEIYDGSNAFLGVLNYQQFLVKKKSIMTDGHTYVIRSRQCYLSDVFRLSDGILDKSPHPSTDPDTTEDTGWPDEIDDRMCGVRSGG